MWLPRNWYPSRTMLIQPVNHTFVNTWNPSRDVIFFVAIVEFGNHLPDIMEAVGVVWWWFVCVSKSLHDIFKLPTWHVFFQSERGATERFDGFGWPPVPSVWNSFKPGDENMHPKSLKNSDIYSCWFILAYRLTFVWGMTTSFRKETRKKYRKEKF